MNYDLSLYSMWALHAGDVADVGPSVRDVDTVDGQDMDGSSGVRQRFSVLLGLHATALLLTRRSAIVNEHRYLFKSLSAESSEYLLTRIEPLDVHPSVELHHCSAVEGEGFSHQQLNRVLRKQLDIVNLTSCPGRKKEGGSQQKRSRWHSQQFFFLLLFLLDQRKWLPFGGTILSYIGAVPHMPVVCQSTSKGNQYYEKYM